MIDFDTVNKFKCVNGHMDGHVVDVDRTVIVVLPEYIYFPPMAHDTAHMVWDVIPYKGHSWYSLYEVDEQYVYFAFRGYCP